MVTEITTNSSSFTIDGIKYSIKTMSHFVVYRNFPEKKVSIEYLPSGKLVMPPRKCNKILLDGVTYPDTLAGLDSCFLDLQNKITA